MDLFFGWGSRLEGLQGCSLLCNTKFLKILGTHFKDLGRMKGKVDSTMKSWNHPVVFNVVRLY